MTANGRYQVGDVVYAPYNPTRYGKVIGVRVDEPTKGYLKTMVEIVWKDGTVSELWELHVRSLDDLIESHRKKLAGHEKRRELALDLDPVVFEEEE